MNDENREALLQSILEREGLWKHPSMKLQVILELEKKLHAEQSALEAASSLREVMDQLRAIDRNSTFGLRKKIGFIRTQLIAKHVRPSDALKSISDMATEQREVFESIFAEMDENAIHAINIQLSAENLPLIPEHVGTPALPSKEEVRIEELEAQNKSIRDQLEAARATIERETSPEKQTEAMLNGVVAAIGPERASSILRAWCEEDNIPETGKKAISSYLAQHSVDIEQEARNEIAAALAVDDKLNTQEHDMNPGDDHEEDPSRSTMQLIRLGGTTEENAKTVEMSRDRVAGPSGDIPKPEPLHVHPTPPPQPSKPILDACVEFDPDEELGIIQDEAEVWRTNAQKLRNWLNLRPWVPRTVLVCSLLVLACLLVATLARTRIETTQETTTYVDRARANAIVSEPSNEFVGPLQQPETEKVEEVAEEELPVIPDPDPESIANQSEKTESEPGPEPKPEPDSPLMCNTPNAAISHDLAVIWHSDRLLAMHNVTSNHEGICVFTHGKHKDHKVDSACIDGSSTAFHCPSVEWF
jgi:hypothetical protein